MLSIAMSAFSVHSKVLRIICNPVVYSGEPIVAEKLLFKDDDLKLYIQKAIAYLPGIDSLRPHQMKTCLKLFPIIYSEKASSVHQLFVISQACGSGKSIYPALVAAVRKSENLVGRVLVITASNVLCLTTLMGLSDKTEDSLSIGLFTKLSTADDFIDCDVVIVNPENVISSHGFGALFESYRRSGLTFTSIFIDEAHNVISQMNFRVSWIHCIDMLNAMMPAAPIVLMSGTLPPSIVQSIVNVAPCLKARNCTYARLPIFIEHGSRVRDELRIVKHQELGEEAWKTAKSSIIADHRIQRILIICLTKKMVDNTYLKFSSRVDDGETVFRAVKNDLVNDVNVQQNVEEFSNLKEGVGFLIGTSSIIEGVSFDSVTGVILVGGAYSAMAMIQARFRVARNETDAPGVCSMLAVREMLYGERRVTNGSDLHPKLQQQIPFSCSMESVVHVIEGSLVGKCIVRLLAETIGETLPPQCGKCTGCILKQNDPNDINDDPEIADEDDENTSIEILDFDESFLRSNSESPTSYENDCNEKKSIDEEILPISKLPSELNPKRQTVDQIDTPSSPGTSKKQKILSTPSLSSSSSSFQSSVLSASPNSSSKPQKVPVAILTDEERSEICKAANESANIADLEGDVNFAIDLHLLSRGAGSYQVLGLVPVISKYLVIIVHKHQCIMCSSMCGLNYMMCPCFPADMCSGCFEILDKNHSMAMCDSTKHISTADLGREHICPSCYLPHKSVYKAKETLGSAQANLSRFCRGFEPFNASYFRKIERFFFPCIALYKFNNDLNPIMLEIFKRLPKRIQTAYNNFKSVKQVKDWALQSDFEVGPNNEMISVLNLHAVWYLWFKLTKNLKAPLHLKLRPKKSILEL